MAAKKKLYISGDKVLTGVLGGIADYLDIDSTVIRILYVLITVFTGFIPGIIGYFAMFIIVPKKGSRK